MENTSNELKCYCCYEPYNELDKFCGNCGYPFQATPEEQKQFSLNYSSMEYDKKIVRDRIREVRILLFIISIFTLIQALLLFSRNHDGILLIINLFITGTYAGLGFWASYKAFAAILTGGLLYVALILLSAFIDPVTILSGIIFKVIFIIAFIKAAYGAYKYKV